MENVLMSDIFSLQMFSLTLKHNTKHIIQNRKHLWKINSENSFISTIPLDHNFTDFFFWVIIWKIGIWYDQKKVQKSWYDLF